MVNPREKCWIEPSAHAKSRLIDRGLGQHDLERMVRDGAWVVEGGADYSIVYRRWHLKVRFRWCLIWVVTVFGER